MIFNRTYQNDLVTGYFYLPVIVQDNQLSIAIGKKGQNVKLAIKLTGWHIDIISDSKYDKMRFKDSDKHIHDAFNKPFKAGSEHIE